MAQEKQGSQGQEINGNLEIKIVFFMMSGFSEGEKKMSRAVSLIFRFGRINGIFVLPLVSLTFSVKEK